MVQLGFPLAPTSSTTRGTGQDQELGQNLTVRVRVSVGLKPF